MNDTCVYGTTLVAENFTSVIGMVFGFLPASGVTRNCCRCQPATLFSESDLNQEGGNLNTC